MICFGKSSCFHLQGEVKLYHLEKSAVAKHNMNFGHCIQFHNTSILAKKSRCIELSLGKWYGLNFILITLTGRKVSSRVGHGNLPFKPWSNERRFSLRRSDLLIDLTFLYACLLYDLLPVHFFLWNPPVGLKRALTSSTSCWPGQDSIPSCTPSSGPDIGIILLPTSYWPGWDSTLSCTSCPVSVSNFKPYLLHPEDGGNKALWKAGILPYHYTLSQPVRPWIELSAIFM
jgi:hypothetical protein